MDVNDDARRLESCAACTFIASKLCSHRQRLMDVADATF
jgi:hypothetical protein